MAGTGLCYLRDLRPRNWRRACRMTHERLRSFLAAYALRRANSSESSSVATMCRVSSVVVVLTMAQSGYHAAHPVNNKVNIFYKCFFLQPTTTPAVIGDVRWVKAARRRLSCQVQGEPEPCLSPRSRAFSFTSRLRTNGGKKDGRRRTVGAEPTEKVGFGFPSISTKSWATSSARL